MPKFYFDISDGAATTTDPNGIEFDTVEIAREEATRTLSEIAAQELPGDGPQRMFSIVVSDSERLVLFEVQLSFSTKEYSTSEQGNDDGSRD